MAPTSQLQHHRDDAILVLIGLALALTFVADALGWFTAGLFFR